MKRITTWIKALSVLALLIVGLQTGPVQAWQTSYSGLTWISADSSYFRRINLDTVTAWHNYDIYFPKTPAASQADGSRMFNFTTTVSTDPSNSGAEWTGLYSAINKTSQTTGVMTLNGIEGVARAQGKSIGATLRGVYGRTYASADTHKVTTMIGGDFSSRSASGWKPKFGTAFVGVRIWMANGSTAAMGQDSINNYHGLWIYDENTSGLATTNAIKINTGGARFKYDLALQDGQTITDTTGGTRFNKPILVDTVKAKVVATTAMSEITWIPAITRNLFYAGGWVNSTSPWGVYSVTANGELDVDFPHRKLMGAQCVLDSVIIRGICNKNTDSLMLDYGNVDSLGVISYTTLKRDTIVGTGSRAAFRSAAAWTPADTLCNVTGYKRFFKWSFKTGRTDTFFVTELGFKYHTIPGP